MSGYPLFGVTGLPCSGKSYGAQLLASGAVTGAPGVLVKADEVGHTVLTRPEVVDRLRERFGDATVAGDDHAAIRQRIAEKVFNKPEDLAWLESLLHPLIGVETNRLIAEARKTGPAVVEAALMFVPGWGKRGYDLVIVVEADFSVRLERALGRGWNREELERRDKRQLPLFDPEKLRRYGDTIVHVTNNDDDGLLGERMREALAARGMTF